MKKLQSPKSLKLYKKKNSLRLRILMMIAKLKKSSKRKNSSKKRSRNL